jgi:hypothetical protein
VGSNPTPTVAFGEMFKFQGASFKSRRTAGGFEHTQSGREADAMLRGYDAHSAAQRIPPPPSPAAKVTSFKEQASSLAGPQGDSNTRRGAASIIVAGEG